METIIYDWKEEIKEEELKHVKEVIDAGGVIIFPTDTVYGIGCNCFNEEAIDKLFEFKQRDYQKPINVLAGSIAQIESIAYIKSEKERKLIEDFMPGALTVILDKKDNISNLLTSNLKTVGVRIPNNKIALEIISKCNYPLATTSVNISGEEAGIKLTDFVANFSGKVDIIIDGNISLLKQASTIVRVDDDKVNVLREGTVIIDKDF